MFLFIKIDTSKNELLCSTEYVGIGELVEIYQNGMATPMQIVGRTLQKIQDPNLFEVCQAYGNQEAIGKRYAMAEDCIFRVMKKTMSGTRRRKFSAAEKSIVDLEHDSDFKEKKVIKAKTGSVRKKTPRKKSKKT